MYLPLAALLALGVCAVELALARFARDASARGSPAPLVLALAALSFARAGDYRTEIALWAERPARARRDTRRAHYNLGKAYEREGRADAARKPSALAPCSARSTFYSAGAPAAARTRCARGWTSARCTRSRGEPAQAEALYRRGARARARRRLRALAHGARAAARARRRAARDRARARVRASARSTSSGRRDAAALEGAGQGPARRGRPRGRAPVAARGARDRSRAPAAARPGAGARDAHGARGVEPAP